MGKFRKILVDFGRSDSGATLVEYGVALVVAIVVGGAALVTLADDTSGNMTEASSALNTR